MGYCIDCGEYVLRSETLTPLEEAEGYVLACPTCLSTKPPVEDEDYIKGFEGK